MKSQAEIIPTFQVLTQEQVFNSLIHCKLPYYPPAGEMNHESLPVFI